VKWGLKWDLVGAQVGIGQHAIQRSYGHKMEAWKDKLASKHFLAFGIFYFYYILKAQYRGLK
jgi:hypothetical protein